MSVQVSGPRINHLVLTVRDINASHRFYTEMLGFERCGEYAGEYYETPMWFYRGHKSTHHDLALVQAKEPDAIAPPTGWPGFFPATAVGVNHVAIGYGTREEWLERVKHLKDNGVEFLVRGNHGMTHSAYIEDPDGNGIEVLYDVPSEAWQGDVNAALSYFEMMPTEGDETLEDSTDYRQFSAPA